MNKLTADNKAQINAMRKFERMMGKIEYYCYRIAKSGKWACCSYDSGNGAAIRASGGTQISAGIVIDFVVYVR